MAENNQVNGQSEEPRVSFDSAKIADKERVEQFTNIDGEKERQAAAERAKKEAEKKQQAARDAKIEQAIEVQKLEKESEKIERRQGNILYRIFWNGWHKIITIILLVVLVLIGAFFAWKYLIPHELSAEERKKQDVAAQTLSNELINKADAIMINWDTNENAYEDAEKLFTDKLNGASDIEKVYINIQYANFVYKYTKDADKALSIMNQVESSLKSDKEKRQFYLIRYRMYEDAGEAEKAKSDLEILNGLQDEDEDED